MPVTATFIAPPGWSAGRATATLASDETVQLQVPVTAPAGPPPAGLVPALTAEVTAGPLPVAGTAALGAFADPDPAQAVLALDAGGPSCCAATTGSPRRSVALRLSNTGRSGRADVRG